MNRNAEDQEIIDRLVATLAATRAELLAQQQESDQRISRLRHDLRGILSPALLLADRLAMSEDPTARRAAEAMIHAIERAEAALAAK